MESIDLEEISVNNFVRSPTKVIAIFHVIKIYEWATLHHGYRRYRSGGVT